jgi:hypothetical protein
MIVKALSGEDCNSQKNIVRKSFFDFMAKNIDGKMI